MVAKTVQADVVVLGSGPGGYAAAFRAADLGKQVVLVERYEKIGGVCLNVGCIPSKSLLHLAEMINGNQEMAAHGIDFGKPKIDMAKVKSWKNGIIGKLTSGLQMLSKRRGVTVITGIGEFIGANQLKVNSVATETIVEFKQAIIAAGSQSIRLPFLPEDPRIFDSTGALELANPTGKMLVIGGGIIGCEMATVYRALGAEVTVVEMLDQIMPGTDIDLVKPCQKIMSQRGIEFQLKTKVVAVKAEKKGLLVTMEGENAPQKPIYFDQILMSVGRIPNGKQIGADAAGITVDEHGFIPVDKQLRTNIGHIYALGDIVGNPMLAHKAHAEGHVVAEVIAGKRSYFDARCIPSVAYTDPEVAWVGKTEIELKAEGVNYGKGVFPWLASGRSQCFGRTEGLTKLLIDKKTNRIIGGGIVGRGAGDLIAEIGFAIEMGADVADIALTIHPHPTLAETIALAAEAYEGTITDL